MKVRFNEDHEVVKHIQEGLKQTGGYCPCRLYRYRKYCRCCKCYCIGWCRCSILDVDSRFFRNVNGICRKCPRDKIPYKKKRKICGRSHVLYRKRSEMQMACSHICSILYTCRLWYGKHDSGKFRFWCFVQRFRNPTQNNRAYICRACRNNNIRRNRKNFKINRKTCSCNVSHLHNINTYCNNR